MTLVSLALCLPCVDTRLPLYACACVCLCVLRAACCTDSQVTTSCLDLPAVSMIIFIRDSPVKDAIHPLRALLTRYNCWQDGNGDMMDAFDKGRDRLLTGGVPGACSLSAVLDQLVNLFSDTHKGKAQLLSKERLRPGYNNSLPL